MLVFLNLSYLVSHNICFSFPANGIISFPFTVEENFILCVCVCVCVNYIFLRYLVRNIKAKIWILAIVKSVVRNTTV
jgi:hypothetical protein